MELSEYPVEMNKAVAEIALGKAIGAVEPKVDIALYNAVRHLRILFLYLLSDIHSHDPYSLLKGVRHKP